MLKKSFLFTILVAVLLCADGWSDTITLTPNIAGQQRKTIYYYSGADLYPGHQNITYPNECGFITLGQDGYPVGISEVGVTVAIPAGKAVIVTFTGNVNGNAYGGIAAYISGGGTIEPGGAPNTVNSVTFINGSQFAGITKDNPGWNSFMCKSIYQAAIAKAVTFRLHLWQHYNHPSADPSDGLALQNVLATAEIVDHVQVT